MGILSGDGREKQKRRREKDDQGWERGKGNAQLMKISPTVSTFATTISANLEPLQLPLPLPPSPLQLLGPVPATAGAAAAGEAANTSSTVA